MSTPTLYNYGEAAITFSDRNGIMVNATEMAKAFGKRPIDWLRLPYTEQFLKELEAVRKSHRSFLIQTENGVGTWMHEDVAIEFARWLSPAFAIWCNDRIKELLTTGKTELKQQTDEEMILAGYKLLMNKVEEMQKTLELQAPKVEYYETVLQSETLIHTTIIAKELGMSAVALNRFLNEQRIIYKCGETWVLYQQYLNKGYTGIKTHTASYIRKSKNSRVLYSGLDKWFNSRIYFLPKLLNS